MAKTIKKESKIKSKKPQTKPVVETVDNDDVEPVLVNEKNEIIYDIEGELEKITKSSSPNYEIEIDNDIKEGLDFIKNGINIPKEIENNPGETVDFVEKKMEELVELKDKLTTKKNTINSQFPFSAFWNGMTL